MGIYFLRIIKDVLWKGNIKTFNYDNINYYNTTPVNKTKLIAKTKSKTTNKSEILKCQNWR